MVIGDILDFYLRWEVDGEPCGNAWQMVVLADDFGGTGDPFTIDNMNALELMVHELLIEDMIPWVTSAVIWSGFDVRNLFNPLEVAARVFADPYVGTNASERIASFVTPVIISPRKIVGMHGGRKALPPSTEAVTVNGNVTGGLATALAAIAGKWNLPGWLIQGGPMDYTLAPVIVKRVKTEEEVTITKKTYALPTTAIAATYYLADNWGARTNLGSQNTRKP